MAAGTAADAAAAVAAEVATSHTSRSALPSGVSIFQQTGECDPKRGSRALELSRLCLNPRARLLATAAGCKLNQRARSSDG